MARAFDAKSEAMLAKLDPRLEKVLRIAHEVTPFDWRMVQTARTIEQQREYYRAGTSRVNPDAYDSLTALYKAAKHITGPGMPLARAGDVALVGRDPYHVASLAYLAGVVALIAYQLGIEVRWGGDFDQDGLLLEPGTFHDLPHFELM